MKDIKQEAPESKRYMEPYFDYSFKRIFGQEDNKILLIEFLNSLLEGEVHITDVIYQDKEQVPENPANRTLIYDIYCKTDDGKWIIVEMQNKRQSFFLQRSLVYTANALIDQTQKGKKVYDIKAVYFIALMRDSDPNIGNEFRKDVVLCDKNSGKQFTDLVRLIYLQIKLFKYKEEECDSLFLKWIYVLNNMDVLDELPKGFQCEAFKKLKEVSDISTLTDQERVSYKASKKAYDDMVGVYEAVVAEGELKYEAGKKEGRKEGVEIEKRENAKKMKEKGLTPELINEITGLSVEEIKTL